MTFATRFQPATIGNGQLILPQMYKPSHEEVDEASTSLDTSADDNGSYDEDDSDSSWDDDMDELMEWFNGTIVSPHDRSRPMLRSYASMPVLRRPIQKPKLIGSLGGKSTSSVILNRLANCQNEFLQAPQTPKAPKATLGGTDSMSPQECLNQILKKKGFDSSAIKVPQNLFVEITKELIAAHSFELTYAARSGNLKYLKECHEAGQSLQCCNKHGESIVHIVCRRGNNHILKFLLKEAKVNPMMIDDVGRTPLHDAAWTENPNFDLVKLLLKRVPLMLYVKDSRKHTPLSYVPRQSWPAWCAFLTENQATLVAAVMNL